MKRLFLSVCITMACISAANAGIADRVANTNVPAAQSWSAWGGSMGVRWNYDLMANLGVRVESRSGQTRETDFRGHEWFGLREAGGLVFSVHDASLQKFNGGSLTVNGGYVLALADGSRIDLRNATLRVNANNPLVLDLVSTDGKVWFFTDRLMFELTNGNRTLSVHTADLRITRELAQRLHAPEAEGWGLGDFAMNTDVTIEGSGAEPNRVCSTYPWPGAAVPGVPGATYQADLFMQNISIQSVGCQSCSGATGNGIAGFAPSSTLRNNVNDGTAQQTISDPLGTSAALYTADVAWFTKFSGNNPPYNNDQHPFLIWNLYRVDANGGITQVGRSGVKHAFVSTNTGCTSTCGTFGGHALGLGCSDTYSSGNNDSPSDMGPRSEIIPATGQWGRCGSIFDTNCDGSQNNSGNTSWTQRMKVPEKRLAHSSGDGVSFLFESWYIVRDDINIYNSMATESVNPQFSGSQWALTGASNYRLGGAIDRWVDPSNPGPNARTSELKVPEGHAKLAVKVTDLGGGRWRYNYAVMNFDFARAETQGAEPNLRVLSNKGFDAFSVPVPANVRLQGTTSDLGESDPSLRWSQTVANGQLTWSASASAPVFGGPSTTPATLPTLDWGTLYSFSFITTSAPVEGSATLHVAQAGTPASYELATLVPGGASQR
ncbi:MAG: hypothetical protein ACTHK2_15685 [Dokdonella sp.]|uniref:hypothetical protein n=1 Tax=Dokdonella sp. TaxID=2291710 RepID=UPI003F7CE4FB